MIKYYCDRCDKVVHRKEVRTIILLADTYHFCEECYKKIRDFAFGKEVEKDE